MKRLLFPKNHKKKDISKIKKTQYKLEVESKMKIKKKKNCRFWFTNGSMALGHLCFEVLSPKKKQTIN